MGRLTDDMRAWMVCGVGHQVGACSPEGRPCLSRGLAADVEPDGRVLVLLSALSGHEVLDAVRTTRRVALNLTEPTTHRSMQLKGVDAEVRLAETGHEALIDRRREAFYAQLRQLGHAPEQSCAWYAVTAPDVAAIRFTPLEAFDQTPGPGAGAALALGR